MAQERTFNDRQLQSIHEQAAEWFVRIKGGTLSEEEVGVFEQWLSADQRNREEYQAVKALWCELDGLGGCDSITDTATLSQSPRKRVWLSLAVAASTIIVVVAVLVILQQNPSRFETAKGYQRDFRLADESLVRLNTDSLLQAEVTKEQRSLHLLRGEAYFDVSHDPQRPFVVNTAGGYIRVLGTRFNVYREASRVVVAVVKGRVEVTAHNGDKRLLSAGQKVAYGVDGNSFSAVGRQNSHDLDWLEGRVHFEATPLIDVVAQLNRYLESPLLISDPGLNQLKLSGSFRIANIKSLPELLPRLLPVSLHKAGDRLLLHPPD